MATAAIKINGVAGSDTDLPIGDLVTLTNVNDGDEVSYTWQIVSQPSGTPDVLSATSGPSVTFTPRREGTYLIQLTVNAGLGDTVRVNRVVVGVRFQKSWLRVPAANETTEDPNTGLSVPGWHTAMEALFRKVDDLAMSSKVLVCLPTEEVDEGDIVRVNSRDTIKTSLPGEEYVPTVTPSLASAEHGHEWLGYVESAVDGSAGPWTGVAVKVRFFGFINVEQTVDGGAPDLSGRVYLNNSGKLSRTPGTYRRPLGRSIDPATASYRIFFDGSPLSAPDVHNVGGLYNATLLDGWVTVGAFVASLAKHGSKALFLRSTGHVPTAGDEGRVQLLNSTTAAVPVLLLFGDDAVAAETQQGGFTVSADAVYLIQAKLNTDIGAGPDEFTHFASEILVYER